MTLFKIEVRGKPDPHAALTVFHKVYHIEARFQHDAEEKAKTEWRESLPQPEISVQEIQVIKIQD